MNHYHSAHQRLSDATAAHPPANHSPAAFWRSDDVESLELQRIRQRKRRANLHRFPFFSTDTMIFLAVTVAVILFTAGLCYSVISTLNESPVVYERASAG